LRSADVIQDIFDIPAKVGQRVGPPVGQLSFGKGPDALVGVQLRRVGREVREAKPRVTAAQHAKRFPLVGPGVVQEDDHRSPQMPQQVAEELADFRLADVGRVKAVVESEPSALGTHRDRRDHRDLVPAVAVTMEWRLTPGRPGPQDGRDQEEPRFVREDEVGAQPRGVFFTRFQSFRFHASIASSWRSTARRSGFWWLHPRFRRRRPT